MNRSPGDAVLPAPRGARASPLNSVITGYRGASALAKQRAGSASGGRHRAPRGDSNTYHLGARHGQTTHVLLLVSDEHNANVAGFAGVAVVRTPTLDKLAASGGAFNRAD